MDSSTAPIGICFTSAADVVILGRCQLVALDEPPEAVRSGVLGDPGQALQIVWRAAPLTRRLLGSGWRISLIDVLVGCTADGRRRVWIGRGALLDELA